MGGDLLPDASYRLRASPFRRCAPPPPLPLRSSHGDSNAVRLAHQRVRAYESVLTALPKSGNMHSFEAHAPTVLLDVLGPPYDDAAERPCSYYRCDARLPQTPFAPRTFNTLTLPGMRADYGGARQGGPARCYGRAIASPRAPRAGECHVYVHPSGTHPRTACPL